MFYYKKQSCIQRNSVTLLIEKADKHFLLFINFDQIFAIHEVLFEQNAKRITLLYNYLVLKY